MYSDNDTKNISGVPSPSIIMPGDFFSTPGRGISGWLNRKMTCTPRGNHTDRFHFGVIDDPVFDADGYLLDFRTCESIWKGPSELRFFENYIKPSGDIELYRIPGITLDEGIRLAHSISTIGDKRYGFKDILEAALDVGRLLFTGNLPPYKPEQFLFSRNKEYICTEIPAYGADYIGKPIEPPGKPDLWDIPVLYLQAIEEGRLTMYYKGDLRDICVKCSTAYKRQLGERFYKVSFA